MMRDAQIVAPAGEHVEASIDHPVGRRAGQPAIARLDHASATPVPSLLVGCAGWSVPGAHADAFPLVGSHLQRYASRFPAVEINSSFYRSHRPQTYARWADAVPAAFRFSVKLPRAISHDGRLAGCDALIAQFVAEAGALGDKLGCILVQLPPSLQFDAARDHAFFSLLTNSVNCMVACEARHASWFGTQATALLTSMGVTRVQADPPVGQSGAFVPTTAAAYLRLHGSPKVYYSSYSEQQIDALTRQLCTTASQADAWCIFDNTASGAATGNALFMLESAIFSTPIPSTVHAPADSAQ